jgi:Kef-type K+ transport system membrane component KefB
MLSGGACALAQKAAERGPRRVTFSLSSVALLLTSNVDLNLPLLMLAVFGSAKVLAELFENFGFPGLVGEIIAGVIIGPSVLGWITPNSLLTSLSELGVMFLLFRVGLEVKSSELVRVGGTALVVATSGVIIPFVLGYGILRTFGGPTLESIFLGASMTATSVGITAQVLASKGFLNQRASRIILAAAVIDDVLGLLVLAVVSSLAKGKVNILDLTLTAVLASGFVVIVALWGTHMMRQVVPKAAERLRVSEAEFALATCLLFALGLLAMETGVAAIVGAFLAGMAIGESVTQRVHVLMHGATELLVPFFLAGLGLRIDLSVFRSGSAIALALIVLAAALVSKVIGCGIVSLPLGRLEAIKIGVGMMPRGEVGMVVGQLGLTMGILSTQLYDVVVFMAIATTIVAPPFIKLAFQRNPEPVLADSVSAGTCISN